MGFFILTLHSGFTYLLFCLLSTPVVLPKPCAVLLNDIINYRVTHLQRTELEIISPVFLTLSFKIFLLLGLHLISGAHMDCTHTSPLYMVSYKKHFLPELTEQTRRFQVNKRRKKLKSAIQQICHAMMALYPLSLATENLRHSGGRK